MLFKIKQLRKGFTPEWHILTMNFMVSFSGAVLTYVYGHTSDLESKKLYAVFIFFGIFTVYNLHRFYKRKFGNSEHGRTSIFLGIFGLISLVISAILLAILIDKWYILGVFALLFLISFWYVYPFLGVKLREIKLLKALLVASAWTIVTAVVPSLLSTNPLPINLITGVFFYLLALTIPFDIRDIEKDNPLKFTLPQLIGIRKSKLISVLFFTVGILFTIGLKLNATTILVAFSLVITYILLLNKLHQQNSMAFYSLFDLMILAYSGLVSLSL